jgi:hypothetical protein
MGFAVVAVVIIVSVAIFKPKEQETIKDYGSEDYASVVAAQDSVSMPEYYIPTDAEIEQRFQKTEQQREAPRLMLAQQEREAKMARAQAMAVINSQSRLTEQASSEVQTDP